jgi:hypothetical protein
VYGVNCGGGLRGKRLLHVLHTGMLDGVQVSVGCACAWATSWMAGAVDPIGRQAVGHGLVSEDVQEPRSSLIHSTLSLHPVDSYKVGGMRTYPYFPCSGVEKVVQWNELRKHATVLSSTSWLWG